MRWALAIRPVNYPLFFMHTINVFAQGNEAFRHYSYHPSPFSSLSILTEIHSIYIKLLLECFGRDVGDYRSPLIHVSSMSSLPHYFVFIVGGSFGKKMPPSRLSSNYNIAIETGVTFRTRRET